MIDDIYKKIWALSPQVQNKEAYDQFNLAHKGIDRALRSAREAERRSIQSNTPEEAESAC